MHREGYRVRTVDRESEVAWGERFLSLPAQARRVEWDPVAPVRFREKPARVRRRSVELRRAPRRRDCGVTGQWTSVRSDRCPLACMPAGFDGAGVACHPSSAQGALAGTGDVRMNKGLIMITVRQFDVPPSRAARCLAGTVGAALEGRMQP